MAIQSIQISGFQDFVQPVDLPTIYRGLPFGPLQISLADSSGNPIDITGAVIRCGNQFINFLVTIISLTGGSFTISQSENTTASYPLGRYPYDLTAFPIQQKPLFGGFVSVKQPQSIQQSSVL
jgi:hypothetical protein